MKNNVTVHGPDCACHEQASRVLGYSGTFEEELAYAQAEVIAAINAERVMAEVIGR